MNTLARILHALIPFARAYDRGYKEGVDVTKRHFLQRLEDQDRSIAALTNLHRTTDQ